MKPRKTWILVADGARARIVENAGPGTGLVSATNFDYAAPHAPSRDFGADKPGRVTGGGVGSHHAFEPKVDWHSFEKHLFAKELAKALEGALQRSAFDDLVLVAPPKALGELRLALTAAVKDRVTGEVGKDFTHLTIHELGDHLTEAVRL